MFTSPQFSKGGVELAGQTCDVTVARDHSGEDGAKNPTGVQIKSNVDKVGDVTITRIMGLVVGLLGVAVLTGFDPLSLEDEV